MIEHTEELLLKKSFNKETNDCSVLAAAHLLNRSYDYAHTVMYLLAFRKHGQGVTRGTFLDAMGSCGLKIKKVSNKDPRIWGFLPCTPWVLETVRYGKKKSIILFYSGHVAAMINGVIYDWPENLHKNIDQMIEVEYDESLIRTAWSARPRDFAC